MTDSDESELPSTGGVEDLAPVPVAKLKGKGSRLTAKVASRSENLKPETFVTVSSLLSGEERSTEVVEEALIAAGFLDGLPDGDTFQKGYARLQRYLGYGRRPDGVPDAGSLMWLSLRTQLFTAID